MKKDQVPQDESDIFEGKKKLVYAVDKDGHYSRVQSSGWEVETFATKLAVDELKNQAEEAYKEALDGQVSPLKYYMLNARHDLLSLAQATGFFQWRIKRHFKPNVFKKLNKKVLSRYAQELSVSIRQLQELPEKP